MILELLETPVRTAILAGRALVGAALAPGCPACGSPMARHRAGVCLSCWDEVDAEELAGGDLAVPIAAIGPYQGRLRRVVRCFKFHGLAGLADPLGERLARRVAGLGAEVDLIVPVPLHWTRRWRRGYNQAELVARRVARSLGRPLAVPALRRIRRTAPQRGRSRRDRMLNVRQAFVADAARVRRARVLLVDDVATTGATLAECARVLEAAGARQVRAAAVARTLTHDAGQG